MNKREWQERQANIVLIEGLEPTHVITLNTHTTNLYRVTVATVMEFERRLNRVLFGRNWRKHGKALKWVHNYETEKRNAHTHSFVRVDEGMEKQVKTNARKIWYALTNERDTKRRIWIDTYDKGAAVYSTKQATIIANIA